MWEPSLTAITIRHRMVGSEVGSVNVGSGDSMWTLYDLRGAEKASAQLGSKTHHQPTVGISQHLSRPMCDTMKCHAISPKWDAFGGSMVLAIVLKHGHTAVPTTGPADPPQIPRIFVHKTPQTVLVVPLFNCIARFDPRTYPSAYTPFLKHNALCMSYFCLLSAKAMSASQYAVHLIRAVYHIRLSESAVSY